MFTDKAKILVIAGKGGNGCVSFHREKYVASGGPDGGDGGNGGNVVLQVDEHISTLLDFRYRHKYVAENAQNGSSCGSSGRSGKTLIIHVPPGTLVKDSKSGQLMADMVTNEPYIIAKGGRGGWGNQHFATPTRQAPHFAKSGLDGEEIEIQLELKLLADVGLVGFPNVGKSSLLSVISAARPKIADYHFTTLVPNLGVVSLGFDQNFVCADIPGLIEGAADGAGLGHEFLRHVERCRLLIHLVDLSGCEGRNPCQDFDIIQQELKQHAPELAQHPQIVVANKLDIVQDENVFSELEKHVAPYPLVSISAATTQGVDSLVKMIWNKLSTLPPVKKYVPDFIPIERSSEAKTTITRDEDVWVVEGDWIVRLLGDINFTDYESKMYFEKVIRKNGVYDQLEELGIEEDDIIRIYAIEFRYVR